MRAFVPLAALASLLLSGCSPSAPFSGPLRTGTVPPVARESSGLAASRRDSGILWTHNDSGGQPVLYAIEATGARRGDLRIADLLNRDWEDLASFTLDGRSYLLIADVGDNASRRNDCALYIVAEPDPADLSPLATSTARATAKPSPSMPRPASSTCSPNAPPPTGSTRFRCARPPTASFPPPGP